MTYEALIAGWSQPLPVVAGPKPKYSDRLVSSYLGDEQTLLDKTAHVRTKGEEMIQFYARVGLGKAQILQMSKAEITKFVEVATASRNEELKNSPVMNAGAVAKFTPKPLPSKMTIKDPASTILPVGF